MTTLDENFDYFLNEQDNEGDLHDEGDKVVDEHDPEHFDLDHSDASNLHVIAPEHCEGDDDEDLEESRVLSIPARLKVAQRMRRNAKRYAMLKKIKSTRMAPESRLKMRARKAALMAIRRRVAGKSGKSYSELSLQQRMSIDQQVNKRYPGSKINKVVDRLAQRLMVKIRKKEMDRLSHARTPEHAKDVAETIGHKPKSYADSSKSKRFTQGQLKGMNTKGHHDPLGGHINQNKSHDGKYDQKELEMVDSLSDAEDPYSISVNFPDSKSRRNKIDEARKAAHGGADSGDEGDKHILQQLTRASMNRGTDTKINWTDGSSSEVHHLHAKAAVNKFRMMVNKSGPGFTGIDKQRWVRKLGASEKDFYSMISEEILDEKKDPVKVVPLKKMKAGDAQDNPNATKNVTNPTVVPNYMATSLSPHATFGEAAGPAALRVGLSAQRNVGNKKQTTPARIMRKPFKQNTTRPVSSAERAARMQRAQTRKRNMGAVMREDVNEGLLDKAVGVASKLLKKAPPKKYNPDFDEKTYLPSVRHPKPMPAVHEHKDELDEGFHIQDAHKLLTSKGYHYDGKVTKGRVVTHQYLHPSNNENPVVKISHKKDNPEASSASVSGYALHTKQGMQDFFKEDLDEEKIHPNTRKRMKDLSHMDPEALGRVYARHTYGDNTDPHSAEAARLLLKKKGFAPAKRDVHERAAENLEKKAEKSGIDLEILEEVFLRGMEDNDGDEQAAFHRVNSFIHGGFAARLDEDLMNGYELRQEASVRAGTKTIYVKDAKTGRLIRKRVPVKAQLDEVGGAGEAGTPALTKRLMDDTPHMSIEVAAHSVAKPDPFEIERPKETGKSPTEYLDTYKALSGKR